MKVLVTAGSKHGATTDIAAAIGEVLSERGLDAVVAAPDEVRSVGEYDAVVLGSAVYAGHWVKSAKALVDRAGADLSSRPVWVFSSGPIGDPPKPEEEPVDGAQVSARVGAREHRVFAGKVDKRALTLPERAIMRALKAPEGDFRDFDDVRAWAAGIADALLQAA